MHKFLAALSALVLVTSVVFAVQPVEEQEFILKLGIQPQSSINFSGGKETANIGVAGGFEYYKYFTNIIAAGAGALYELPREFKDSIKTGSLSYLPIFVGVKLRTPVQGLSRNYGFAAARIGYSSLITNGVSDWMKSATGGLYYAGGLGLSLDWFVFEAVYSGNNISYKNVINGKNETATTSTITIFAGVKFE